MGRRGQGSGGGTERVVELPRSYVTYFPAIHLRSRVWWCCVSVILDLGSPRQEECEFEASLGYTKSSQANLGTKENKFGDGRIKK